MLGVEERLHDTPEQAHVRGLFFRLAEQAARDRGPDLLAAWRAAVGARFRWPFRMYPARECIREQAVAAVMLDPDDPARALREMWATTPRLSGLIRADRFIDYLTGRDPHKALTWLERNRAMMCDYGAWRVDFTGPASATFHYFDEYIWIEHAHRGGVEGTLSRCGVSPIVSVELDSPYRGRLQIRWA